MLNRVFRLLMVWVSFCLFLYELRFWPLLAVQLISNESSKELWASSNSALSLYRRRNWGPARQSMSQNKIKHTIEEIENGQWYNLYNSVHIYSLCKTTNILICPPQKIRATLKNMHYKSISIKRRRFQATDWKKIYATEHYLIKDCYPKINK